MEWPPWMSSALPESGLPHPSWCLQGDTRLVVCQGHACPSWTWGYEPTSWTSSLEWSKCDRRRPGLLRRIYQGRTSSGLRPSLLWNFSLQNFSSRLVSELSVRRRKKKIVGYITSFLTLQKRVKLTRYDTKLQKISIRLITREETIVICLSSHVNQRDNQ